MGNKKKTAETSQQDKMEGDVKLNTRNKKDKTIKIRQEITKKEKTNKDEDLRHTEMKQEIRNGSILVETR